MGPTIVNLLRFPQLVISATAVKEKTSNGNIADSSCLHLKCQMSWETWHDNQKPQEFHKEGGGG